MGAPTESGGGGGTIGTLDGCRAKVTMTEAMTEVTAMTQVTAVAKAVATAEAVMIVPQLRPPAGTRRGLKVIIWD